jgi:hypothetical protein
LICSILKWQAKPLLKICLKQVLSQLTKNKRNKKQKKNSMQEQREKESGKTKFPIQTVSCKDKPKPES